MEVYDIPYTINGKKVELAIKKIIHNQPVNNNDSLSNPECLEQYKIKIEKLLKWLEVFLQWWSSEYLY